MKAEKAKQDECISIVQNFFFELAAILTMSNNKNLPKAAVPKHEVAAGFYAAITAKIAVLSSLKQRTPDPAIDAATRDGATVNNPLYNINQDGIINQEPASFTDLFEAVLVALCWHTLQEVSKLPTGRAHSS